MMLGNHVHRGARDRRTIVPNNPHLDDLGRCQRDDLIPIFPLVAVPKPQRLASVAVVMDFDIHERGVARAPAG